MFKSLYRATIKYAEDRVPKSFNNFCNENPRFGYGLFLIIFPFTIVGWADEFEFSKAVSQEEVRPEQQIAGASEHKNQGETGSLQAIGGPDHIKFTSWWKPDEKNAYGENGHSIFLRDGYERVRFDYTHPVPVNQTFKFDVALGGVFGGNYQFGRLSGYELTIGDGDFQSITLKDSTGNLVKEKGSQSTKVYLPNKIKKDTNFLVEIKEIETEYKTIILEIYIMGEKLVYEFDRPKKWTEKDDVYFGLIDYSEGENDTSVYWADGININK